MHVPVSLTETSVGNLHRLASYVSCGFLGIHFRTAHKLALCIGESDVACCGHVVKFYYHLYVLLNLEYRMC